MSCTAYAGPSVGAGENSNQISGDDSPMTSIGDQLGFNSTRNAKGQCTLCMRCLFFWVAVVAGIFLIMRGRK